MDAIFGLCTIFVNYFWIGFAAHVVWTILRDAWMGEL